MNEKEAEARRIASMLGLDPEQVEGISVAVGFDKVIVTARMKPEKPGGWPRSKLFHYELRRESESS